MSVKVQDTQACPRYCAALIQGVKVGQSPLWLQNRLKSIGLKPINNVVDITNFILWDQGQPLHAFDRDKIQNIQVEWAKEGEEFLSLEDRVLKLSSEDLVIKDKKSILALAGIIGAKDSSISSKTQNIVIEAAYFAPQNIRKSSRRLGIETDSSYRFTRGLDPSNTLSAMNLACSLIQQVAGGTLAKDFYDIGSVSTKSRPIFISTEEVSQRLAYEVSPEEFKKAMQSLACDVQSSSDTNKPFDAKKSGQSFKVIPPSYRHDLHLKEDLIEEFARLFAYDKIPETLPPSLIPQESHKDFTNSQKLIDFLSSSSWSQSLNYSFCDPVYFKEFIGQGKSYLEDLLYSNKSSKKTVSIKNPISQKLSLMKPLLTPDLFKNILYNYRRNNKAGQLFEFSPVFYQNQEGYQQEWNLALALWSPKVQGNPKAKEDQASESWNPHNLPNFYKMKNLVESLLQAFQISAQWEDFSCKGQPLQGQASPEESSKEDLPPASLQASSQAFSIPFLHPKQTLILKHKKQKIGLYRLFTSPVL